MKSSAKKIICIALSLVLAFGALYTGVKMIPAEKETQIASVAKEEAKAGTASVVEVSKPAFVDTSIAATVILPGISQSNSTYCDENGNPILNADGNELSGGLLIIDSAGLVWKLVKKLALPLLTSLFTQNVSSNLKERVTEVVSDLFAIQSTDKDGNAKNNLVVDRFNYPVSQYSEDDKSWFYNRLPMEPVIEAMNEQYGINGEDYTYLYTFPLIGDPMTSADGLFDFIAMVKQQTGCKKVNLVAISMGGTILTAYCDLVAERGGDFSDINKIVNIVACLNGTDMFADFYDRSWNLSDEFLYGSYISSVMQESGSEEYVGHLVNIALRILPKSVLYAILSSAMDALLDTLLVNCPQFWSMIPSDRYEEIAEKYLSGDDYSVLRARTDRFQSAKLDLNENLSFAHENYGVNVYSVCGYGRQYDTGDYCFLGIAASNAKSNSDSIIDIDSSSLGATYATAGEALSDEYIASLDTTKYVSPDKSVDASTCLFPSTTWFFNGQHHEVGRDDVVIKLLANIISGKVTDVDSTDSFTQFSFNRNTRTLTREDGLIDKAEKVMANAEGLYTQEQIDAVKPVYDKAVAMLANTVLTADSADEAKAMTDELNNALAPTGLTSTTKSVSIGTKLLNKIFEKLDEFTMVSVGGQGFSDKATSMFK